MRAEDMTAVFALAELIHPGFPEDDDVLAERRDLYPAGCFVLETQAGLRGYLLSHPWRANDPPALNRTLGRIPADADTYYLHDLALHSDVRGAGAAKPLLLQLFAETRIWPEHSLVAVNGSAPFWQHHGFAVLERPGLAAKLAGYGADARYMVRH